MRAMAAATNLPVMPWPNAWPNSNAAWPISKAGRLEKDRILGALAASGHAPEAFSAPRC